MRSSWPEGEGLCGGSITHCPPASVIGSEITPGRGLSTGEGTKLQDVGVAAHPGSPTASLPRCSHRHSGAEAACPGAAPTPRLRGSASGKPLPTMSQDSSKGNPNTSSRTPQRPGSALLPRSEVLPTPHSSQAFPAMDAALTRPLLLQRNQKNKLGFLFALQ